MIVQSGGVGSSYLRELGDNAIIPGKFAAIGNKLQIDEVDIFDYLLKDEKTDIITMYMEGFKRGTFTIMVATDIAARGIDVSGLSHVINFDMPDTFEAYTHRTGGPVGPPASAMRLPSPPVTIPNW